MRGLCHAMYQTPKRSHIERALEAHYDKIHDIEQSHDFNYGKTLGKQLDETSHSRHEESEDETEQSDKDSKDKGRKSWIQSVLFGAFFFLVHGAMDTTFPYLAVYYKQLGLDVQRIGILTSVQSWVAIPWTPFTGYIADKFSIRKMVLCSSLVCAAIAHMGLYFVPEVKPADCVLLTAYIGNTSQVDSNEYNKDVQFCSSQLVKSPLITDINSPALQEILVTSNVSRSCLNPNPTYRSYLFDRNDLQRLFIYLLILNIICQLLGAAWYPLGNAEVLDGLGRERRNHYGYFKAIGGMNGALR